MPEVDTTPAEEVDAPPVPLTELLAAAGRESAALRAELNSALLALQSVVTSQSAPPRPQSECEEALQQEKARAKSLRERLRQSEKSLAEAVAANAQLAAQVKLLAPRGDMGEERVVHYHGKDAAKVASGEEQSVVADILKDAKAEIARKRHENTALLKEGEALDEDRRSEALNLGGEGGAGGGDQPLFNAGSDEFYFVHSDGFNNSSTNTSNHNNNNNNNNNGSSSTPGSGLGQSPSGGNQNGQQPHRSGLAIPMAKERGSLASPSHIAVLPHHSRPLLSVEALPCVGMGMLGHRRQARLDYDHIGLGNNLSLVKGEIVVLLKDEGDGLYLARKERTSEEGKVHRDMLADTGEAGFEVMGGYAAVVSPVPDLLKTEVAAPAWGTPSSGLVPSPRQSALQQEQQLLLDAGVVDFGTLEGRGLTTAEKASPMPPQAADVGPAEDAIQKIIAAHLANDEEDAVSGNNDDNDDAEFASANPAVAAAVQNQVSAKLRFDDEAFAAANPAVAAAVQRQVSLQEEVQTAEEAGPGASGASGGGGEGVASTPVSKPSSSSGTGGERGVDAAGQYILKPKEGRSPGSPERQEDILEELLAKMALCNEDDSDFKALHKVEGLHDVVLSPQSPRNQVDDTLRQEKARTLLLGERLAQETTARAAAESLLVAAVASKASMAGRIKLLEETAAVQKIINFTSDMISEFRDDQDPEDGTAGAAGGGDGAAAGASSSASASASTPTLNPNQIKLCKEDPAFAAANPRLAAAIKRESAEAQKGVQAHAEGGYVAHCNTAPCHAMTLHENGVGSKFDSLEEATQAYLQHMQQEHPEELEKEEAEAVRLSQATLSDRDSPVDGEARDRLAAAGVQQRCQALVDYKHIGQGRNLSLVKGETLILLKDEGGGHFLARRERDGEEGKVHQDMLSDLSGGGGGGDSSANGESSLLETPNKKMASLAYRISPAAKRDKNSPLADKDVQRRQDDILGELLQKVALCKEFTYSQGVREPGDANLQVAIAGILQDAIAANSRHTLGVKPPPTFEQALDSAVVVDPTVPGVAATFIRGVMERLGAAIIISRGGSGGAGGGGSGGGGGGGAGGLDFTDPTSMDALASALSSTANSNALDMMMLEGPLSPGFDINLDVTPPPPFLGFIAVIGCPGSGRTSLAEMICGWVEHASRQPCEVISSLPPDHARADPHFILASMNAEAAGGRAAFSVAGGGSGDSAAPGTAAAAAAAAAVAVEAGPEGDSAKQKTDTIFGAARLVEYFEDYIAADGRAEPRWFVLDGSPVDANLLKEIEVKLGTKFAAIVESPCPTQALTSCRKGTRTYDALKRRLHSYTRASRAVHDAFAERSLLVLDDPERLRKPLLTVAGLLKQELFNESLSGLAASPSQSPPRAARPAQS